MNRLTKYEPNTGSMFPYRLKDEELSTKLDSIHKLGELEDIEEELGIELTVLFSALKNGVYYFAYDGQLIHDYVSLVDNYCCIGPVEKLYFTFKTFYDNEPLLFADYGKTWSLYKQTLEAMDETKTLSKEELENENQNKTN